MRVKWVILCLSLLIGVGSGFWAHTRGGFGGRDGPPVVSALEEKELRAILVAPPEGGGVRLTRAGDEWEREGTPLSRELSEYVANLAPLLAARKLTSPVTDVHAEMEDAYRVTLMGTKRSEEVLIGGPTFDSLVVYAVRQRDRAVFLVAPGVRSFAKSVVAGVEPQKEPGIGG